MAKCIICDDTGFGGIDAYGVPCRYCAGYKSLTFADGTGGFIIPAEIADECRRDLERAGRVFLPEG